VALARRCRINELVFIFLCISLVSIGVALAMDIGCGTFRPWSAEYRMGGSLHPNQLARIAAVAAMIANVALMQHRSRLIWLTVLAACLVVVWMTRSRSGMAGCAAGLIALQFIGISRRSLTFSGMVLLVALSLTGMFLATAPSSLQRQLEAALLMGRTDQAVSLTGRVPLWKEIWRDGSRRPWTGYGYGAYWITDRIDDIGAELRWYPRHSHSAYMEVLLDLGIVGATLVVLLALLSIAAYSRIAHVTGRLQYRLFGALFVSGLANGFFEVAFISPRFEGLFVGVAVAGLFVCHREAADSVSTVEDQRLYTDLGGRLCPT
jgi:O-antigen ligase